jgi:hypothetical protein
MCSNSYKAWFPVLFLTLIFILGSHQLISAERQDPSRKQLAHALLEGHVLIEGRQILRLVHLCNVHIGSDYFPVVDLVEQVPGAQVPRGVRRLVLLDERLRVFSSFTYYSPAEPLFCKDADVYFSGEIQLNGTNQFGNVLTFFTDGKIDTTVRKLDSNSFPAPGPMTLEKLLQ